MAGPNKVMRGPGQSSSPVHFGYGLSVGPGDFVVMAGPCALESSEQVERAV